MLLYLTKRLMKSWYRSDGVIVLASELAILRCNQKTYESQFEAIQESDSS